MSIDVLNDGGALFRVRSQGKGWGTAGGGLNKAGQAQPNLAAYDSLGLGGGGESLCDNRQTANSTSSSAVTRAETGTVKAAGSTLLLLLSLGLILLAANVWFWVCFVVR